MPIPWGKLGANKGHREWRRPAPPSKVRDPRPEPMTVADKGVCEGCPGQKLRARLAVRKPCWETRMKVEEEPVEIPKLEV